MTKKLEDYTQDELIEVVKNLRRRKKFGLVWEDKPEEVVGLCQTNLPVLEEVAERAIIDEQNSRTNIFIEGDNYHSLSALNYTHAGKVDVIYIDPPYNTGSNDFIYNDKYVDREDTFRHSKWLSFMSKRLRLAKQLLSDEGIIYISIDDNEHSNLKMLCDEIFDEAKFLGTITWEKRTKSQNTKTAREMLQLKTEYVLAYKNVNERVAFALEESGEKKYELEDNKGLYRLKKVEEMSAKGMRGRKTMIYPIMDVLPRDGYQWKVGKATISDFLKREDIQLVEGKPYQKIRPSDESSKTFTPFWSHFLGKDAYGTAETGKSELKKIFDGDDKNFETVKPVKLIKKLLFHVNKREDVTVLDFFAGSGTTAQAVRELNEEDGGSRKFILCTNNENNIADEIAYPRIKKVIEGYSGKEGLPTNVRYFKTSLVSKKQTDDQTRVELVARSTDMICIREDTFGEIANEGSYKVFKGNKGYSAIAFEPDAIEPLKSRLQGIKDKLPISIYVFSLSNDSYESDFADLKNKHQLRPIPESILEVYKRIFTQTNKEVAK